MIGAKKLTPQSCVVVQVIMLHVLTTVWEVSPAMVVGLFVLLGMAIAVTTLVVIGERSLRPISHVTRDDYPFSRKGTEAIIKIIAISKPLTMKAKGLNK